MSNMASKIKMSIAGVFAALTALWGWFCWLSLCFVFCLALDFVTGTIAAGLHGDWSSTKARKGLWHKLGSIVAVLVSAIFDLVIGIIINNLPALALSFEYTVLLCPLVMVWYIMTELGSTIENAAKMGAPIPPFLRSIIAVCRETTEKAGERGNPGGR